MLRIIKSVRIPRPIYVQCFSSEAKVNKAHTKNKGKKKGAGEGEEGGGKDESLESIVKFYDAIQETARLE